MQLGYLEHSDTNNVEGIGEQEGEDDDVPVFFQTSLLAPLLLFCHLQRLKILPGIQVLLPTELHFLT